MRIAIYSRKSKWTGKGESIENQLLMCKEYVMSNFPDIKEEDIYEYEDEGFSGKNTQRPQFQKMMWDFRKEHYDFLVCYKLDRLGRNLTDLVNLIEELNKMETSFISIKEKFDTSTPIGRAMMFFTGVLAQMEREQIAERVKDNMLMLARSGRWLGGTTPLGFESKKDEVVTWNNKKKTSYRLSIQNKEMDMVRFIYREFLEKQSLSQLDTYFAQNDIKTRNGKDYQISTIRDILTNPVYCTADQDAYDFFNQLGCQVCIEVEELDGIHGLMSYSKTSSSKYKNKSNNPSEWIISLAKHRGIIRGKDWVKVQQILEQNKKKGDNFRKVQNPVALLSGILYCQCGDPMRPKNYPAERLDANGNRTFAYLCSRKEKSNRQNCNITNVSGNTLDQMVYNELLVHTRPDIDIYGELRKLKDSLEKYPNTTSNEIEMLQNIYNDKKTRINQLIISLSKSDGNDTFLQYIKQQITQLDKECKELELKIVNISKSVNQWNDNEQTEKAVKAVKALENQIASLTMSIEALSILEKREYLRTILSKVIWDGETAHIFMRRL
jgi:site-specific DNA recombinase